MSVRGVVVVGVCLSLSCGASTSGAPAPAEDGSDTDSGGSTESPESSGEDVSTEASGEDVSTESSGEGETAGGSESTGPESTTTGETGPGTSAASESVDTGESEGSSTASTTGESGDAEASTGATGPTTRAYILFGQSNMWGQTTAEAQDMATIPRTEVLTLDGDCPAHGANAWVAAAPSLHGCVGNPGQGSGAGLGPGDYFARIVGEAHPEDTILLVPNAIPGASINCFAPPGSNLNPGATNCPLGAGPTYESMLSRSQMAQARGEIRGILFHQGESDCGQDDWPQRVKLVVDRLRSDLGTADIPFLAAEIPGASACQDHNGLFEGPGGITEIIENAHIVQAEDLPIYDTYHFTTEAQRTLGQRFGERMLEVDP